MANIVSLGADYAWYQALPLDLDNHLALFRDKVGAFLASFGNSDVSAAIYGGSGSGCLLLSLLKEHRNVRVRCVVDRLAPQNSLAAYAHVRPDDLESMPAVDVLFVCCNPAHFEAIGKRLAGCDVPARQVCFMYGEKPEPQAERALEPFTERIAEHAFVFTWISRLYPRRILDVGTGPSPLPALMALGGSKVTAIDHHASSVANRSFYVWNHDIQTGPFPCPDHGSEQDGYDLITCVSTLEHIPFHDDALASMDGSLKPGGHLLLTIPFCRDEYIANIHHLEASVFYDPAATDLARVFSLDMVRGWEKRYGWRLITEEYHAQYTGKGFGLGTLLEHPEPCTLDACPDLACLLFRKIQDPEELAL